MNKSVKQFMMSFLVVIVLLSCSEQSNASELEKRFSTLVPLTDMNKSLRIAVNTGEASFRSGSEIELVVYNQSPYALYFDNDSHMRLLDSSDTLHWVEVKNAFTYSATMMLSPKGTILLDHQYTLVRPMLDPASFDKKKADVLLRIVVIGEIMDGDTRTGKKVGAFVDVTLTP